MPVPLLDTATKSRTKNSSVPGAGQYVHFEEKTEVEEISGEDENVSVNESSI